MKVARRFAELLAERVGPEAIDRIDALNRVESNEGVCHSHDFCDANVFMQLAVMDVTGIDAADHVPAISDPVLALWQKAWDTAKRIGFRRLNLVLGVPDIPADGMVVDFNGEGLGVQLPGLEKAVEHPLEIYLDYWGRNPHLQVLCYDHDSEEGEPKVCVRYARDGKVVEVRAGDITLVKRRDVGDGEFKLRLYTDTTDTPWEIERDANPPCMEGDKLRMPSGLTADVVRLRDRYDGDIEQFRAYDAFYGILSRMDGYPGSRGRNQVYTSIEQAWEANPFTASTVEPSDFSFVPEHAAEPVAATDDEVGKVDCFAIFCDTLCQGRVPVGTVTEQGKPTKWSTFATERQAQLEIVDDFEEHLRQFKAGERGFDEIVPDCYVQAVTLHPDGSLSTEDGHFPPPEQH